MKSVLAELALERRAIPSNNGIALLVVMSVFTALGCLSPHFRANFKLLIFLATAVLSRLYVRKYLVQKMGLDDVAILVAWICSLGFLITVAIDIHFGIGSLIQNVPTSDVTEAFKIVYAVELIYYCAIYSTKLSILLLYDRLFRDLRSWTHKFIIGTIVLITVYFVVTLIVCFIQCIPLAMYWDPTIEGKCINIIAFFYSTNIFTIATDLWIIFLPIPKLWGVKRPMNQKIALVAAFLIGALSTIASCVRLYSIRIYLSSTQLLDDAAPITLWSFIEINFGLLCACGPALKNGVVLFKKRSSVSDSSLLVAGDSTLVNSTGQTMETKPWKSESICDIKEALGTDEGESAKLEANESISGIKDEIEKIV